MRFACAACSSIAPQDCLFSVLPPLTCCPIARWSAHSLAPHWQVGTAAEAAASAAAARLVAACHAARQFTDTANFALRCGICQAGLKGEREAAEHAKATGHTRFTEY